jgi:hypothetical protein
MKKSIKSLQTWLACAGLAFAAAGCASSIDDGAPVESTSEALSGCLHECKDDGKGGASWVFQAPQADLFSRFGHFAGTHYVGPTWEYKDGSSVVGNKIAAATVDPTAIPWLLLEAKSHDGEGRMEKITYIQRLETVGGLAPGAGCDVGHLKAIANVDYTATYAFYDAKKHP